MATKTIGIDFGHCETAAAYPFQVGDKNEVKTLVVNDLNANVGSTQIILTDDQMRALMGNPYPKYDLLKKIGPFQIGRLPASVPNGERFLYFKVAPRHFHEPCGNTYTAKLCKITHAMVMACYIYATVDSIIRKNATELEEADWSHIKLLIGCPTTADWTGHKEKGEYAKLVELATGVESVEIIPESRAAMFSSVSGGVTNISAVGGAAVFDFGSSTTDCTYMLLGRKILEFSWALGASEVERQISQELLERAVQDNGPFTADPNLLAGVIDELRIHKEEYYAGLLPTMGKSYVVNLNEDVEAMIKMNETLMERVTGERKIEINCDSTTLRTGSWQDLCRAFFQEAKERIQNATYTVYNADGEAKECKCTLDTIVLTGGASKMGFIETICREVFPEKNVRILRNDVNPSHTVSNGLGWVSVADENLERCKAEAKAAVLSNPDCAPKKLSDAISDEIFELLCSIAKELTQRWADAPGDDMTIKTLQDWLESATKNPEVIQKMQSICGRNLQSWKKTVSSSMEEAVNAQTQALYASAVAENLILPSDIWQNLDAQSMTLNQLDMHSLLTKIDFSDVAAQIGKYVLKAVIWCAGAVFLVLTGGLSVLLAWLASELTNVLLSDKDMNKPRKRDQRQNVAKQVSKVLTSSKETVMKSFTEAFAAQTESFEAVVDSSLDIAFKIVTLQRFEV